MMMKLPALLLLLLLPLSSASLQDIVKKSSQHRNVSVNLAPEDRIPEITSKRTMSTDEFLPSSAMLRQKRQTTSFCNSEYLQWMTWTGSLPGGYVGISNSDDKEVRGEPFDILVNKDNFEILEWQDGSYGSVPQHSVRTCWDYDIYVGKNKYGLGKVHVRNEAFFLPWKGSEYFYKSYQVLTCNQDVLSEDISDVRYNIDGAKISKPVLESMNNFSNINNDCRQVPLRPSYSSKERFEKRWDITHSFKAGVKMTFTGGIPGIISGSVEVGGEVSFQFSSGHTIVQENERSVSMEITIPPRHTCTVSLIGYRSQGRIPFTASLRRTYRNGQTRSMSISGTSTINQVSNIHIEVGNCEPIPGTMPCV
uniref:Natterin-3-like n=1 Tax=Dicentrarchus labrax TaxID=13489 RepID=A0A8P4K723_DICLA